MRYNLNPIDWSVIDINELEDIKQDLGTYLWFAKFKKQKQKYICDGDNSELEFFYSGLVWKVFLRFIAANDKLAFMFSVYRYFLVIHLFFHVADMTSTCLTLFPPQFDRLFHDSPFLCIAHPWSHLDRWGISLSSSLVCSKSQFNEKSFNCRKYFRPPLFAHPEAKLIPWNTPVRRIVISNPHIPTLT